MFSYFREIKDIRAFRLLDGNTTVYIRQNKQLVFNKFVKAEWETKSFDIPSDYNFHRVYKYDTYSYILVDQENKGYLFSFITDTINKLSFEYYFYDEESQRGIISTVTSYNPYSCRNETFDLRQNKILWGLDNSFVIMPLSNLFLRKRLKILFLF